MEPRRFTRLAIAGLMVVVPVASALAFVVVTRSGSSGEGVRAIALKKSDSDAAAKSRNVMAVIGEARDVDYTPGVEAYLLRAYPNDEVPTDASVAAQDGWRALNAVP